MSQRLTAPELLALHRDLESEGDKRVTPQLIAALVSTVREGDRATRGLAGRCLTRVGAPAIAELVEISTLADARAATIAVSALGVIDHPDTIEPLIEALGHRDPSVRRWAAKYLGLKSDKRIIEALETATSDSDHRVRRQAERALYRLRG